MSTGTAESEIRLVEGSYDDAWQRGDVAGLIACLTQDAVLVSPRGDVARGHDQIRQVLGAFLSSEAKGSEHHSEIQRIEFVTDNVAIVDGEAHVVGLALENGRNRTTFVHGFTDVLVRRHDGWAIAHVRAYDRQSPSS